MKAVILAGGLGTRLSEETYKVPKPMVEIGERPILWHIMKIYSHFGIDEFIICLGYKGYIIKEFFLNYFHHTSDVSIDVNSGNVEVHRKNSESWKITLVDTGFLKRQVEEWGLDEDGCRTREDVFVDAYDARVLDKWWDELWEYDYPINEFYFSKVWQDKGTGLDEKLKDLIWKDYVDKWEFEKYGLRNQLADDFRNCKSIIPDDFIEELH